MNTFSCTHLVSPCGDSHSETKQPLEVDVERELGRRGGEERNRYEDQVLGEKDCERLGIRMEIETWD